MPKRAESLTVRRRRIDDAARMSDLLRAQILDGSYGPGALPSESELMLEYAVGRNVTRDALDLLRQEGLIERIQGSGTFVVGTKALHHFDRAHAINDSMPGPRTVSGAVLSVATTTAPRPVAEQLGLVPGAPCVWLQYLAVVSGVPFSITTSYVSEDVGHAISRQVFDGDFYLMLESAGLRIGHSELVVESVAADAPSAAQLDVAQGTPLLLFRRRLVGEGGRPLEVGFVRCRGDRLSLRIELPRTPREPQ
ncbi:MAG: GntR family transcriptional regulator [Kineosporiaceae bacterium]